MVVEEVEEVVAEEVVAEEVVAEEVVAKELKKFILSYPGCFFLICPMRLFFIRNISPHSSQEKRRFFFMWLLRGALFGEAQSQWSHLDLGRALNVVIFLDIYLNLFFCFGLAEVTSEHR